LIDVTDVPVEPLTRYRELLLLDAIEIIDKILKHFSHTSLVSDKILEAILSTLLIGEKREEAQLANMQ
jgi:hypothetical protein